ncbi:hypothetical protein V501_02978 [Pseudogymnoascus sp. VKM F-4519 (FW-2642)]|nr:hypothetical protein V501_02978 [Pseudogymnoascus sp. VKM F-4519 (FW-2642)]
MAGYTASPTITGRGAENMPQPPPNVAPKDRFRFRSLLSKYKNPANGSVSASSSVATFVENATPAPSSVVSITTPNTNSGLETSATATEAPISELWNEAWDELRKNTALFEEYETRLTASSSSVGLPSFEKYNRAQMMKVLLEKKIEELESGQWKIGFQNNQFAVKDLIEPVVGLVLNPGEQEAARAKCLEGIAALLRQCSIREALYRNSYDGNTERKEANLPVHISYREELKILYIKVLTFQATCLCHLSHRTGGRIIRDMAIWTDWDELSTAIDVQKERMGEIEAQWRDFKLQEQWNKEEKRHSEHMDYLDPMSNEIRRIREVTEKAQNDKFRLGLLQWLSSEDFSARYNDIWSRHEESTGDWLIENNRYHDWKKKQSSFLWLYGKAGSGKSYLSAPAIHSLTGSCENSPYKALAYYYFSFTEQPEQDASRMLSSIIRQLCGARPDSPAWLNNLGSTFRDKGARPTLEHLEGAVWNAVEGFNAVYLIIDALDECTTSKSTRATLMKSLVKLQKCSPPNVHILVTSRKEPDIEAALDRVPLASEEKIDLFEFRDAVNHDMDIYLQQKLDSPEFDNMSDDTKTLARSLLLEKADGMFQYVALQLIEIENSLGEDIPKLLANLPQGLDETYIRMLKSIDSRYYPIVYRILLWIAMSKEPLSPKMLAEAAIIDPRAESPFDPRKRMKGLEKPKGLLKLLPGLLREEEQVRREEVSRYALHKDEANHFMAESCICYHLYASQVKDVTKDNYRKLFPIWKYSSSYWAEHMEDLDEELWTLPLKEKVLLALKPNTDSFLSMIRMCYIGLTYISYYSSINPDPYSANPVYYISAKRYQRVLSFYLKDLNTKQLDAQINCQLIEASGSFGSPLQAAAYHGGDEIIRLLIQRGADVNAQGGYFGNALQAAASLGEQEEIVKLLLEHGADVNAQGGRYHTALLAALDGNSEETVELLISQGADINAQGRYGDTALHAAACSSSEKVIRLLLELGANVNGQGGHHGNALQAAACRGREEIVRLLLEYGADVNAQGGDHGSALQRAAKGRQSGSEEIVKLLLKLGADVNAQGGMHGNALQGAASSGNKGIVKLLIELGANVNAQGGKFDTALQAAAACGKEGVAELLLQQGADVKCQGGLYGNALQAAACDGSEKLVKLFLGHGADVNTQGGKYGTALQAAASSYRASAEIVKLLLEQGADVNAKGGEYGNALQGAASGGLADIIKLLLEHGGDINAEGGIFGSVLQAAATTGSEDIVKLLLEHGANVNAQGGFYGTALQAAASPSPYGSEVVVKLLLEHGADVNAKGGKFGSALKAAQNCYEDEVMDILLAHGATEQ